MPSRSPMLPTSKAWPALVKCKTDEHRGLAIRCQTSLQFAATAPQTGQWPAAQRKGALHRSAIAGGSRDLPMPFRFCLLRPTTTTMCAMQLSVSIEVPFLRCAAGVTAHYYTHLFLVRCQLVFITRLMSVQFGAVPVQFMPRKDKTNWPKRARLAGWLIQMAPAAAGIQIIQGVPIADLWRTRWWGRQGPREGSNPSDKVLSPHPIY